MKLNLMKLNFMKLNFRYFDDDTTIKLSQGCWINRVTDHTINRIKSLNNHSEYHIEESQ
jgi:hypothetical protein